MSKIIACFTKKEYYYIFFSIILLVTQVWVDLEIPDYMSEITQLVQTEGSEISDILTAGGTMLGLSLFSLMLVFIVTKCASHIATIVAMRLREQVYNKTLSFSMADINNFSTGSLITRSTNDITQIQNFIALGYIAFIRAPLMSIWAVIKISGKNTTFTGITLVGVCSLLVAIMVVITLSMPKSKGLQKLTDNLNTTVREHLIGIRVVRAYNADDYQKEKFENINDKVASANIFINRTTAFMAPYMMFLMTILTLVIYVVGASLINEAGFNDKLVIFSDMVVFSSYAMQIIMAFMLLTMAFITLPRVIVALNRVSEVIDFKNTIVDGNNNNNNNNNNTAIQFKNVSFSYPDGEEAVLENLNFEVNKGDTIAFIGSTGSGKSTIMNLLLRFYDCTKGEILIDGVNLKDYTQEALREKMGYVSQKAVIFSGDIKSNITYGANNKIDDNNINRAIEIAQAKDFVDKVGLDGEVAQGGLNLSGGQKQRLSIARAIYKNPEIYVFDDCFSALDYKTDKVLRAKLNKECTSATKVIVGQRISTIQDANQIIVLDAGKIVGVGTHEELLANSKIYREIAESQLSKEEL
ncbi:MAG: ABC transporter ATP-binding protein [bacterium]